MLEVHVCLYWTSTTLEKYYRILSSGLFKQARFCWKCIFDFTKFCTLWILYGWPSRQEQVGSAPMFTSLWYATPPGCCHAKMTNSHNLCCYATASALPPSCTILHLPLANAELEQNHQKFHLGNRLKNLHHIEEGEQKRAESTAIATV